MGAALDLDDVDRVRGPVPFVVQAGGRRFRLRSAEELAWRELFVAAYHPPTLLRATYGEDWPAGLARLPGWKTQRLCHGYRQHYGIPHDPAQTQRLVMLVQTYGAAIEYDLAVRGADLVVEWQARRWRKLLNLIDRLPRDSAYVEAIADDDAMADQLVLQEPDKASPPRLSDWSPEVEALYAVLDRVTELIHLTAAVHGSKPGTVQPAPRPVTALDRARVRLRDRRHKSLVARVLPGRAADGD